MKNRIKELRKKQGLTIRELSKKVNIPFTTLNQYENGKRNPKEKNWLKLATFFGVEIPYIKGDSDKAINKSFYDIKNKNYKINDFMAIQIDNPNLLKDEMIKNSVNQFNDLLKAILVDYEKNDLDEYRDIIKKISELASFYLINMYMSDMFKLSLDVYSSNDETSNKAMDYYLKIVELLENYFEYRSNLPDYIKELKQDLTTWRNEYNSKTSSKPTE